MSVAVRGVDVESGEIRWSGAAHYPGAISNPEQGVVFLAEFALGHAICPVEAGYEWKEAAGGFGDAGCLKDGKQVPLMNLKHLILPVL